MIRIRGGTIVTMDAARRILEGDLVVADDGSIAAIGDTLPPGSGERTIDARGKLVIPGFVQTHVHLCQTLMRNRADDLDLLAWLRERIWPYEAALDAPALRAAARLGIAELFLNGTTTVLDMGTAHDHDLVFAAAAEAGLRLVSGKVMMDSGDGVPARLKETAQRAIEESLALAKRWHGRENGRLRYAFAPRFVLSCSETLLRDVAAASAREGLLVHTHASEQERECAIVLRERGDTNVAYLATLGIQGPRACLAHCVHATAREIGLLASAGSRVLHCPSSNLKLGSGIAPIAEFIRSGVHVSLGADGAPCNNQLDPFLEMRAAALLQKVRAGPKALPAEQVFALATIEGARALGLESVAGSLEVGKRADVAILDMARPHVTPQGESPYGALVYAGRADQVEWVVVDGRVVVEERRLVPWDEREIVEEGEREARRVRERMLG